MDELFSIHWWQRIVSNQFGGVKVNHNVIHMEKTHRSCPKVVDASNKESHSCHLHRFNFSF